MLPVLWLQEHHAVRRRRQCDGVLAAMQLPVLAKRAQVPAFDDRHHVGDVHSRCAVGVCRPRRIKDGAPVFREGAAELVPVNQLHAVQVAREAVLGFDFVHPDFAGHDALVVNLPAADEGVHKPGAPNQSVTEDLGCEAIGFRLVKHAVREL